MTTTYTTAPCDVPPCDGVTGEFCTRHEREWAHADGEHELCGTECTASDRPSIETLTPRDELYIAVADYIGDREEANATIDAFRAQVRAEVLREAADVVREVDTDPSTQAAADELRRMAEEAQR